MFPRPHPALETALAGHVRYRQLTEQYADLIIAETRQNLAGIKKSLPAVKGSVLAFCNFTFHWPFFRATASRFETLLQLPIASRSATHFNVIVVSRRNRTAIATFP